MRTRPRDLTPRGDPLVRVLALGGVTLMLCGALVASEAPHLQAQALPSGVSVSVVADSAGEGVGVQQDVGGPSYDVARTVTMQPRPAAHRATGRPVRVDIPALDVSAGVVPVTTAGAELVPPSDPALLGWWADGAEPGALAGTALLAGHTVSTGGGALDLLHQLEPGDRLVVTTTAGRIRYEVARVAIYAKPALARASRQVFGQEVRGRLVLVTCSGYDGVEYLSNTVVVARPVG